MNTTIQRTTKYKNSPLGLIPEDWKIKKLIDVVTLINGKSYKQEELLDKGKYRVLRVGNLFSNNNWYYSDLELNDDKYVSEGDLMYAWSASFGPRFWKEEKIIYHYHIWKVIVSNLTTKDFIFHLLEFDKEQILKKTQGGTMFHITKVDMESRKLPIPPLPEQTAIANCLSTWDTAIEKHNALIAQKELAKKALMQQLLSGKKRLKGFGEKWHLKSLEDIATFRNGKAHENAIDENGVYKVVNSKFISTNGLVFKTSNVNLCPLFIDEIAMVMSDIPNGKALAKCFYINQNNKYTLNQRICSIRANDETDSKFLYYILNRNVHYLSFDNGVGQTNLKKEEVLECPLLMPEKKEQTAIANVLQCADDELQLLKKKMEQLKEQKKGLMQVLLTGKKRLKY